MIARPDRAVPARCPPRRAGKRNHVLPVALWVIVVLARWPVHAEQAAEPTATHKSNAAAAPNQRAVGSTANQPKDNTETSRQGAAPGRRKQAAAQTVILSPVVVTGTRTNKTQLNSPVLVELVSHAEIQRTHARTLKEALENVPGLRLTPIHGSSGYQVSLQGLSSDQVLVLVDGLPITASTGSTVDVSQYTLAGVDHIEIVKGATSSLYGSGAMGGVINVITRPIEPGLAANVAMDFGSFGDQNVSGEAADTGLEHARASFAGGTRQWRGRASLDLVSNSGFAIDPDAWARQGDAIDRQQFASRLEWHPAEAGSFFLGSNLYREDDDSRFLFFAPPRQVPQQVLDRIERNRYTAGGNWSWNSGTRFELKGLDEIYTDHAQEFSNAVRTDTRQARHHLSHITTQLDLPLWYEQLWTLGGDWHRETLTQSHGGISELQGSRVLRTSNELFAQADVLLGERWELLAGGRWQFDSDFGSHAVPKLGVRGHVLEGRDWDLTLRASVGQGYRVPNLKERHFLFDHSSFGYRVIGNPGLVPERSNSWQMGASMAWRQAFNAHVNLFRNRVDDLIQVDVSDARIVNGIQLFTFQNIDDAVTQGVETALAWRPIDSLSLNGSYTFTATEDLATGGDLTRRPRHLARLGVDWTLPTDTVLSLRARSESSALLDSDTGARIPAWTLVDLKLNQPLGRGLVAFGGIDNLFDRQRTFEDNNDLSPALGRFIYLGFRYQWDGAPAH